MHDNGYTFAVSEILDNNTILLFCYCRIGSIATVVMSIFNKDLVLIREIMRLVFPNCQKIA